MKKFLQSWLQIITIKWDGTCRQQLEFFNFKIILKFYFKFKLNFLEFIMNKEFLSFSSVSRRIRVLEEWLDISIALNLTRCRLQQSERDAMRCKIIHYISPFATLANNYPLSFAPPWNSAECRDKVCPCAEFPTAGTSTKIVILGRIRLPSDLSLSFASLMPYRSKISRECTSLF